MATDGKLDGKQWLIMGAFALALGSCLFGGIYIEDNERQCLAKRADGGGMGGFSWSFDSRTCHWFPNAEKFDRYSSEWREPHSITCRRKNIMFADADDPDMWTYRLSDKTFGCHGNEVGGGPYSPHKLIRNWANPE